jgi:hypothetical protein
MDRGVKVAIFVASVVSLGLGLIWDQVLNQARTAVAQTASADELGPEVIRGEMGAPEIKRLEIPKEFEGIEASPEAPPGDVPATQPDPKKDPKPAGEWTEYVIQPGDSWWRIAHRNFSGRGLSSDDIERANPGVRLIPGETLRIPPNSDAVATTPRVDRSETATTRSSDATDYVVQENDSWWQLAHQTFRDRGLTTTDLKQANPGVNLRPGVTIKIPAGS